MILRSALKINEMPLGANSWALASLFYFIFNLFFLIFKIISMNNIIVLGAGMVGSAMAIDLAKKHVVTLTDVNQKTLNKAKQKCDKLNIVQLDVTNKELFQATIKKIRSSHLCCTWVFGVSNTKNNYRS